jgi:hypothetical protein
LRVVLFSNQFRTGSRNYNRSDVERKKTTADFIIPLRGIDVWFSFTPDEKNGLVSDLLTRGVDEQVFFGFRPD